MTKVYIRDVPEEVTVATYLKQTTDWREKMRASKPSRKYPDIIEFDGSWLDIPRLQQCIEEGFEMFGEYGWVRAEGEAKSYTGVSLAYNPDHQDNMDVHKSTLGTPKNSGKQFFWNSFQQHSKLKNSYYDSYAFRYRTPFAERGYLGELLNEFRPTLIRSRVSKVHAKYHNAAKINKNWHKDELIFENIRINIPVTSAPEFVFELDGHEPVHLSVGSLYSWDTNIAHGVYEQCMSENTRTHLVFGFSPWWDFNPEDQSWSTNEFYGKHPFDMFYDGDICPKLVMKNM